MNCQNVWSNLKQGSPEKSPAYCAPQLLDNSTTTPEDNPCTTPAQLLVNLNYSCQALGQLLHDSRTFPMAIAVRPSVH